MRDDFTGIRFTHSDHWIAPYNDRWRLGISDFAEDHLGDIIHVDLPEVDDHHYEADEEIGLVESLTSSMELHTPVAGVITAVNVSLLSNSDLINSSPYDNGWIVEMDIDDPGALKDLMNIDEYEADLPDDVDEE